MENQKLKDVEGVWQLIRQETKKRMVAEPVLASFFHSTILEHNSFSSAIADQLSNDLSNTSVQPMMIRKIIREAFNSSKDILEATVSDLNAVKDRDPSCKYFSEPLLFFKGFKALQSHRVANWLWSEERHTLAHFIQSRASEVYGIDIHPAAEIGKGVPVHLK